MILAEETMMDEKKQKRRTVSAARLYWAITDALELYKLAAGKDLTTVTELLDALKDDIVEAVR